MFSTTISHRQIIKYKIFYFLIFLSFVLLSLVFLLLLNFKATQHFTNRTIYNKRIPTGSKKILLWTSKYERPTWGFNKNLNEHILKKWGCEVTNCFITSNKKYRNVLWYDAVMFHGVKVNSSNIPPERAPKQIYVIFSQEPPMYYFFRRFSIPDKFFNWTCNLIINFLINYFYNYVPRVSNVQLKSI